MSEYTWIASAVTRHEVTGLAAVLMCELSMRFPTTKTGFGTTAPRHLMRAAWDDAGYCIDTPDSMPAGACERMSIDEDTSLPVQLIAAREERWVSDAPSKVHRSVLAIPMEPASMAICGTWIAATSRVARCITAGISHARTAIPANTSNTRTCALAATRDSGARQFERRARE